MNQTQSFNHVALSMRPAELSPESRKEICDFYGEVFGWTELEAMTKDNELLVLGAQSPEQFVYLLASDKPMQAGTEEHFGLSVRSMSEFDDLCAKAKARAERDDRVRFIDKHTDDFHGVLDLTSFYVQFLLPLMIEVQHFDWKIDRTGTTGK